jgi:hypothetical protein
MTGYKEKLAAALLLAAVPAGASGSKTGSISVIPAVSLNVPTLSATPPAGLAPLTLPEYRSEVLGHLGQTRGMPPLEAVLSLEKSALARPGQISAAKAAAAQTVLSAVASPGFGKVKPGSAAHAQLKELLGAEALHDLTSESQRLQQESLEHEPLAGSLSRLRGVLLPGADKDGESWEDEARKLSAMFDNEGKTAAFEEPDIKAKEGGAEGPTVDAPGLADQAQLLSLSSLDEASFESLGERLEGLTLDPLAKLPLPGDTTFSLELEFLVTRQLDEKTIDGLLPPGAALTEQERQEWRAKKKLPYGKWAHVQEKVVEGVEAAAPKGWRLTHESMSFTGNTLELKTANEGEVYHENTQRDWEGLAHGLNAVQKKLPGGLFSVHLHASRRSGLMPNPKKLSSADALAANAPRAAKVLLLLEPYWRALFNVPWPTQAEQRNWDLEQPYGALDPSAPGKAVELVTTHGLFANLSKTHPTVEIRLISGLIDGSRPNGRALDAATVKQDLWPAFALARLIQDAKNPLPLASLPLPTFDGKLSRKGMARFLDIAYAGDPAGKALALRTLRAYRARGGYAAADAARRRAGLEQAYEDAGLGVVFELHQKYGGYDEKLEFHLAQDGGALMKRLAEDLSHSSLDRHQMAALFPQSLQKAVLDAVIAARRARVGR